MAIPIPTCPVVVPDFTEIKGPITEDPITGSTITTFPTVYEVLNVCDEPSQIKFQANMTITELGGDSGCEKVQAATISIKGAVPVCATQSDIDTIINRVREKINEGFPA